MDKIETLNRYNFVSGGYIFDLLDRTALQAINEKYPETASQQVYTVCADINYSKQLCNLECVTPIATMCFYSQAKHKFIVICRLCQNETEIADAYFEFAQAEHNYCEQ